MSGHRSIKKSHFRQVVPLKIFSLVPHGVDGYHKQKGRYIDMEVSISMYLPL